MNVLQMINKLGVPLRPERIDLMEDRYQNVGVAPELDVCLLRDRKNKEIFISYSKKVIKNGILTKKEYKELLLHEACHAIVGPTSLDDEICLMVYQWYLMQELNLECFSDCRESFSIYQWFENDSLREIGNDSNWFLKTPDWKKGISEAVSQGFLTHELKPIYSLGPHKNYHDYVINDFLIYEIRK